MRTTNSSYVFILLLLTVVLCSAAAANRRRLGIVRRKRKGMKSSMPTELLKEFIGQRCTITLFNEFGGSVGTITAVEGNWIRVQEKNDVRIINGDMIRDIKLVPAKNKKNSRTVR